MSINPVVPLAEPHIALLSSHESSQGFWSPRIVQNGLGGLTTLETNRLVLRIIAVIAAGACIFAIPAASLGVITWSMAALAIPIAIIGSAAMWGSLQFDEYENPEGLEKFRSDASRVGFEQVMRVYGWENVLHWGILTAEQFKEKFRQQMREKRLMEVISAYENAARHLSLCLNPRFDYQIPLPTEWCRKWRVETSDKSFEYILLNYPIEKLEKYNLLEAGELNKIKALKAVYDQLKQEHEAKVLKVEQQFERKIRAFSHDLQTKCTAAEAEYHALQAVKSLKGLDIRYIRKREQVLTEAAECKNEAREEFQRAVAPITDQGRLSYDQLSPNDKREYDRQILLLQVVLHRVENETREKINQIDIESSEEKSRLGREELAGRRLRDQKKGSAKSQYEAAILPHQKRKDNVLVPIHASLGSSVRDLDGRYRAYLRTVGALR